MSTAESKSTTQARIADFPAQRAEVQFRVEITERRYQDLLSESSPQPRDVMVTFTDAERIMEKHGGFDEVLEPHHRLVITGTEKDKDVLERSKYDEIELLSSIERSVRYVPDYSGVYGWMTEWKQRKAVEIQVRRLHRLYSMKHEREWSHVEVLPLIKGLKLEHYAMYIGLFEEWGIERYALYGVQEVQYGLETMKDKIRESVTVLDPDGVFLIGLGSPDWVSELPPRVDGVAALRAWKDRCGLDKDGFSEHRLHMWYHEVVDSLLKYQTVNQKQVRLNEVSH